MDNYIKNTIKIVIILIYLLNIIALMFAAYGNSHYFFAFAISSLALIPLMLVVYEKDGE